LNSSVYCRSATSFLPITSSVHQTFTHKSDVRETEARSTIAESGVAGYDSVGWYGIVAPVRTSAQIVEALSASISIALRSPDVKEKLSAQAAEPVGGTPSEFKAHIASEASKWAKVIKAAGIRAE